MVPDARIGRGGARGWILLLDFRLRGNDAVETDLMTHYAGTGHPHRGYFGCENCAKTSAPVRSVVSFAKE
jgi:hypothetical protein